jgi:hypothetical protein
MPCDSIATNNRRLIAMRNPRDISFTIILIAIRSMGLIIRNATIMAPMKISRSTMVTTSLALAAGYT